MKIKNQEGDALDSNMSLAEFGNAMKQLNLNDVPHHKRPQAIIDHLMRIMGDAVIDKEKAQEIHISRILHRKRNG